MGVQALHALTGATDASERSGTLMVGGKRRVTLGGVAGVGVGQGDRIDLGLGPANAPVRFEPADGGVRAANASVDPVELAAAHAEYSIERAAALPPGWTGPQPFGGVGGTRQGVKCLHAHYAWYLAGGTDPVGRWVDDRITGVMARGDRP